MKKIVETIQKPIHRYDFICDFTGKPATSTLVIEGRYGSNFDLKRYEFDMSDEFAQKLLDFISSNLKISALEDHISDVPLND